LIELIDSNYPPTQLRLPIYAVPLQLCI